MSHGRWPTIRVHVKAPNGVAWYPRRRTVFPLHIRRWLKRELGFEPVCDHRDLAGEGPTLYAFNRLAWDLMGAAPVSTGELAKIAGKELEEIRQRLKRRRDLFREVGPGLWRRAT